MNIEVIMKRKKTIDEIATSPYLTKKDLQRLFGISYKKANRIYEIADGFDAALTFRIEPHKVTMDSVAKVLNKTPKQIYEMAKRKSEVEQLASSYPRKD